VEFIGQISNDQNTFLQLTSRDACIYVYKKTIYELNNEFRKKRESPKEEEKEKWDLFNEYSRIYKIIFFHIINHHDILPNLHENEILLKFEKLCKKINEFSISKEECMHLSLFIDRLAKSTQDTPFFLECLFLFLKKKIPVSIYKEKINLENFTLSLKEGSVKWIKWLAVKEN